MGPPQIGFVFDHIEAAWDQSFEELCTVSKANGGTAHVTRGDLERPELAIWCSAQVRDGSSLARKLTAPDTYCAWMAATS